MNKYQIIKIPFCLGAPIAGTDKGPDKIIGYLRKSYPDLLKNLIEVSTPESNPAHRRGKYEKIKSLPEVAKVWKITHTKKIILYFVA